MWWNDHRNTQSDYTVRKIGDLITSTISIQHDCLINCNHIHVQSTMPDHSINPQTRIHTMIMTRNPIAIQSSIKSIMQHLQYIHQHHTRLQSLYSTHESTHMRHSMIDNVVITHSIQTTITQLQLLRIGRLHQIVDQSTHVRICLDRHFSLCEYEQMSSSSPLIQSIRHLW